MKLKLLFFIFFNLIGLNKGFAATELFVGGCLIENTNNYSFSQSYFIKTSTNQKQYCQLLSSVDKALTYTTLSLSSVTPLIALLGGPNLMNLLLQSALANPAILTVTVVGVVGVQTFYIVLKASLDQCSQLENQELKASIENELRKKYGLKPINPNININFQP